MIEFKENVRADKKIFGIFRLTRAPLLQSKYLLRNNSLSINLRSKINNFRVILTNQSIIKSFVFNPSRPNPERRENIKLNFYFQISLWCLKRFYEAFIKPFEAPQRSVKIKIKLNFYINTTFRNAWDVKG